MAEQTTLGIDLASSNEKTAACLVRWDQSTVVIDVARAGLSDAELEKLMVAAGKVGIDVPLGWPTRFVDAVGSYMEGRAWLPPHRDPNLRLRATDRHVAATRGRHPLSVSTDRIAIPAMRAARLLTSIDAEFDRAGSGKVVEVYPAVSLMAWGFSADRYKGIRGLGMREELVDRFIATTSSWIKIDDAQREACVRDDNVFDALICALTARAAQLGLCDPIPNEHGDLARVEGWIAMPAFGSLSKLAPATDDWDDEEAYLLPSKDPDHPCPRCGETPWAPPDGFGRMCNWCGWMWEIDSPERGALRILGPSPDSDAAMQKVLGDGESESAVSGPAAGHAGMPWIRDHFAMWLQLRHAAGIKEDPSWPDVVHSSLLARIASGGPVFEDSPPLRYSYHWVILCAQGWDIAGTDDDEVTESRQKLTIAQSAWEIEDRYTKHGRPAWRIGSGPWTAAVEWEAGPFDVGDRYSPPPKAAYVIRLTAPGRLIDLTHLGSQE